MRIGILTLPLHTNYGGILQAFALQTVLERMGHEVFVINKSPYKHLPIYKIPLSLCKRIVNKYILNKNCRIFEEYSYNKDYPIISQYTQLFINKYIKTITNKDYLKSLKPNNFDVIIVGSDQIWRPKYFSPIEDAFLRFADCWNIKRIAYAASFGTDLWEYSQIQTENCKELIKQFNAVSVREISAINLCKNKFNINAEFVLDPTMLLNKNDYINLLNLNEIPKSKGNMLVYILDQDEKKTKIINDLARKYKLTPFWVNTQVDNYNVPINKRIQPGIEHWLKGFYDADFVFTDSFHACVFSIIFQKNFIVYGNENRGLSRFKSLLHIFSLEDRLVNNVDNISLSNINWNLIENQLVKLQEDSYSFLKKNLY